MEIRFLYMLQAIIVPRATNMRLVTSSTALMITSYAPNTMSDLRIPMTMMTSIIILPVVFVMSLRSSSSFLNIRAHIILNATYARQAIPHHITNVMLADINGVLNGSGNGSNTPNILLNPPLSEYSGSIVSLTMMLVSSLTLVAKLNTFTWMLTE